MIQKLCILLLIVLSFIHVNAQENSEYEYDTVYVSSDTIEKTILIVDDTVYVSAMQFYAGIDFAYNRFKIETPENTQRISDMTIPLSLRVQKNNWFVESGFSAHFLTSNYSYIDSNTYVVSKEVSELVFVDTIYKESNGIIEMEIIQKDVTSFVTDTSYTDTTYFKQRNYSHFTIPLHIGYEYELKNLFCYVSVGINTNIYTKQTFSEIQNEYPHEKQISVACAVNIGANYQIFDSWLIEGCIYSVFHSQKTDININYLGASVGLLYIIW